MLSKFTHHEGIVAPININNIDTDVIIPKQFLQKINRKGYGKYLFYDWRYINGDINNINYKFILNKSIFKKATILITGSNFGCGSSREHALWSLVDYGIKIIISSSFADIFYKNAINNRLLPIILKQKEIDQLFNIIFSHQGIKLHICLKNKNIQVLHKKKLYYNFNIDDFSLNSIINGIDHISLTLNYDKKITIWEKKQFNFLK